MIVVADASVAIKWFLPEEGSDDAARLLASDAEFHAPNSLRLDLAGLLQRREMRGEIAAGLARGIARELDRMIAGWHPSAELLGAHMPKPWRAATRSPISSISNCRSGSGRRYHRQPRPPDCMPWASVTALEDWAKVEGGGRGGGGGEGGEEGRGEEGRGEGGGRGGRGRGGGRCLKDHGEEGGGGEKGGGGEGRGEERGGREEGEREEGREEEGGQGRNNRPSGAFGLSQQRNTMPARSRPGCGV